MTKGRLRKSCLWASLLVLVTLVAIFAARGVAFAEEEYDVELQDVMDGNVPGLSADVTGTGWWYGSCMQVRFKNDTTQTLRVKVPIGLRLAPEDEGVQTMYTVGDEVITMPPGSSTVKFKAFCGEENDYPPESGDFFHPQGRADGDLMKTLQRIHQKKRYDVTGQDAVWSHTDNADISGDKEAQDLAGGSSVPDEKAAADGNSLLLIG